jgi:hypothetical protein
LISLRDVQQRTYRAVVLGEDLCLPVGQLAAPKLAALLGVYRNNARETFRRTLAATYPVVAALVGEPCFRGLAVTLMRASPSRSGDLARFGAEFADWLDVHYRDTPFAYLSDVARLEWACSEAETAAEVATLDLSALAVVTAEDLAAVKLEFKPSCRLVASRYPVLAIWKAHQTADPARVALAAGAEHVLVIRAVSGIRLHALDVGAFAFARSLADGDTLADAAEAGWAVAGEFHFGTALAALFERGVFMGYRS